MQQTRPIVTVHPAPAAPTPIPLWERERMFLEPDYADGQPYDQPAPVDDIEDDDLKRLAA